MTDIPEYTTVKSYAPEFDPSEGKSAVGSRRVQGGAVAVAASVYTILQVIGKLPPGLDGPVVDLSNVIAGAVITLLGSAWGLLGGIFATKKITSVLPQ